jgi:SAM-dependent methyltransferase
MDRLQRPTKLHPQVTTTSCPSLSTNGHITPPPSTSQSPSPTHDHQYLSANSHTRNMAEASPKSSTSHLPVEENTGYMLERGYLATSRLNFQFYLWKGALGFNIDPSLPVNADSVIADVAAGTLIWPIDVAREHPGIPIDCFDIDLDQAPHQSLTPSNIQKRYWDIFEDPPADVIGKYDYVHVRLLLLVIDGGDPRRILRNLYKLLKPGGYLQWDEIDCVNMGVKRAEPQIPTPGLNELSKVAWAGGKHDWTIQLPKYMKEEGFNETRIEYFDDPPELVRAFTDLHLCTMEEAANALQRVGKHEAATAFRRTLGQCFREASTGASLCLPRIVAIGRKPAEG